WGEKGLAWVKDPRERERKWGELVRITKEIHALEPVLLAPDAPIVTGGPPAVRVLGKRSPDGARYLFAYNTGAGAVTASWTLTAVGRQGAAHGIREVARQLTDSVDAVLARHEDVHQHDVGRPLPVLLEAVLAVDRERDLVTFRSKEHVENVARVVVIFDDQDVDRWGPKAGDFRTGGNDFERSGPNRFPGNADAASAGSSWYEACQPRAMRKS